MGKSGRNQQGRHRESSGIPWPEFDLIDGEWLGGELVLTNADRRHMAKALNYPGDHMDEDACLSWIAHEIRDPKKYRKADLALPVKRRLVAKTIENLIMLLEDLAPDDMDDLKRLRQPRPWDLISIGMRAAYDPHTVIGRTSLVSAVLRMAWCIVMRISDDIRDKHARGPELFFLFGLMSAMRQCPEWRERFIEEYGLKEELGCPIPEVISPDPGIFDDGPMSFVCEGDLAATMTLLSVVPSGIGLAPGADPGRFRSTEEIWGGFRDVDSVRRMVELTRFDDCEISVFLGGAAGFEACEDPAVGITRIEELSKEAPLEAVRVIWIASCCAIVNGRGFPAPYQDFLLRMVETLDRPALVGGVEYLRAVATRKAEAAMENAVSQLVLTDETGSLTFSGKDEVLWSKALEIFKENVAELTSPADSRLLEELATEIAELQNIARVVMEGKVRDKAKLEHLQIALKALKAKVEAFVHAETQAIRDAIERMPEPLSYLARAEEIVTELSLIIDEILALDEAVQLADRAQIEAKSIAERRQAAAAVTESLEKFENKIAAVSIDSLVREYREIISGVEPPTVSTSEVSEITVDGNTSTSPVEVATDAVVAGLAKETEPTAGGFVSLPQAEAPGPSDTVIDLVVENIADDVVPANDLEAATIPVYDVADEFEDLVLKDSIEAWTLLMERDEPGLAYHLAQCLKTIGRLPEGMPRPEFLRALCFGRTVLVSGDLSAIEIRETLGPAIQDPDDESEAMLAGAALIRAALLAPETGAREWLIGINMGQANFMHRLQTALARLQKASLFLTAQDLRRPPAEKDLAARAKSVKMEIDRWFDGASKIRIKYARADDVWKIMLKRDGKIGLIIEALRIGSQDAAAGAMRDFIREFNGSEKAVDEAIDRIDVESAGPAARTPIIGGPRIRLRDLFQQACTHFQKWLDSSFITENRHGNEARLNDLRNDIEKAAGEAMEGAKAFMASVDVGAFGRGAAAALMTAMEDLLQAISPAGRGFSERDARGMIDDGFMRISGMTFGSQRAPEPYDPEAIVDSIIGYSKSSDRKVTWEEAFRDRLAEHSHVATQRILTILEARGTPRAELERLEALREADIAQARRDLVRARSDLRTSLDQAMAMDSIRNASISTMLDEVEAINPDNLPIDLSESGAMAPIADFPAAKRVLDEVRRAIEKAFVSVSNEIQSRLIALKEARTIEPEDERVLKARLGKGDYTSAAEMLELLTDGYSGLARRKVRPFRSFFPSACADIGSDLTRKLIKEVKDACEAGRADGPFDFSQLTETAARSAAANALMGWMHLKSPNRSDKQEALQTVLSAIGFTDLVVKQGTGDLRRMVFDVTARPVQDNSVCPIPAFGTECGGQWRVTLWTAAQKAEEMMLDLSPGSHVAELAILCNRMSVEERRDLARISRRDRKSVLVLDESLMIWLLMQSEYRLRMFFDCTIPFSWSDPYPSNMGPVSPESFFGRAEELDRIMQPYGSCLVYGGRQLGKSALLAQVEAKMNRPENGQVAIRIDMKSVGADGKPGDIWVRIADALVDREILKTRYTTARDLSDAIDRWLSADGRRRMILMLDEMDDFLVADGERGYANAVKMREIMDNTKRRCKFVLAGLHNVQRASTVANTPLVHFGEPICVGPLDRGTDKSEARRMVLEPLAAAGYEFADASLSLRILSQLNYYPSLVSVVCKQLADRMVKAAASGKRMSGEDSGHGLVPGPVWAIQARDVDEIMAADEARKQIKMRFDITLDLDPRYKLTALILAFRANEDAERGLSPTGVALQDIRKEAIAWWPNGFKDRSGIEAFEVLAEEMEGLGVLARSADGWRLRSLRIVAMMGKKDQIEQDLIDFSSKQPEPLHWEPGLDRSRLSGKFRRSPLNRIQEGEIVNPRQDSNGKDGKRVWIVFGSDAGGIDDVSEALCRVGDNTRLESLSEPPDKLDPEKFGWVLQRKIKEAKPRLFWIGPGYHWDESWVMTAMKQPGLKRSGLRVVFGGRHRHAMKWALADRDFHSLNGIGVCCAQPVLGSALRFWLKDMGYEALDSIDTLKAIEAATGGFPRFLEELASEFIQRGGKVEEVIRHWQGRAPNERVLQAVGIEDGVLPVLKDFAEQKDGLRREDMDVLVDHLKPTFGTNGKAVNLTSGAMLAWTESMGLAFRSSATDSKEEVWRPNPLLGRVLAGA